MVEDFSFLNKDEIAEYTKLSKKVQLAYENSFYVETDFLDPYWQKILQSILNRYVGMKASFIGIFDDAERKAAIIFSDFLQNPLSEDYLSCLSFDVHDDVLHKDVLGTLMSLGVSRKALGDIVIRDGKCYIAVKNSLSNYLMAEFREIRRHEISLKQVDGTNISATTLNVTYKTVIVPSLRLDAIVAGVYNIKRNMAVNMIKKGLVKVDYRPTLNTDQKIEPIALISVRGYGRVYIDEVSGSTQKGNLKLAVRKGEYK